MKVKSVKYNCKTGKQEVTERELSQEEIDKINQDKTINDAKQEIAELKSKLEKEDYKTLKYIEGKLTEEEFTQIKEQKQQWRNRIKELELIVGD